PRRSQDAVRVLRERTHHPRPEDRVLVSTSLYLAGVDSNAAPGDVRVHRHDLRASGASTADENGARATALRDAMGHSFLATTEIYLRSGQAENARTVATVMHNATGSSRRGPRMAPK